MTDEINDDLLKNFKKEILTAVEFFEEQNEKAFLEVLEKRVTASLKRLEDDKSNNSTT